MKRLICRIGNKKGCIFVEVLNQNISFWSRCTIKYKILWYGEWFCAIC